MCPPWEIRNQEISFIFRGFNLIANLTTLENVELPLSYQGIGRSQRHKLATEALIRVGLEHRKRSQTSEMSGGQQRVAIVTTFISCVAAISQIVGGLLCMAALRWKYYISCDKTKLWGYNRNVPANRDAKWKYKIMDVNVKEGKPQWNEK